MVHYGFEWNADKARINERKHGVTFDEAKTIFEDVFALEAFDVSHSADEDRFVMIGRSHRERVLVVSYVLPNENSIRLISAREATRRERLAYEKQADE